MFGLPAACLAMYHEAKPGRRAEAGGLLLSLALTSFLTGVTEPVEFTFMFLAPALFALHALLTGAAMVIMNMLGVKLGFTFSAGLFDYFLNFGKATRPLLLWPVGAAYAVLYYGLFRFFIRRFDLKTPGRDEAPAAARTARAPADRARGYIEALGGAGNLIQVGACTTRLRLVVADQSAVDEAALKALGARGVIRPSDRDLQVVVGAVADQVAREISEALEAPPALTFEADALARALGPIAGLEVRSSRLIVTPMGPIDEAAALAAGARAVALTPGGKVHLVMGPQAAAAGAALRKFAPA